MLVLTAMLVAPVSAAHAAAPPGPRLALIRFIDRAGTAPGSLDVLTTGPGGGARQLVTGTSRPGGVAPVGGITWSPDRQVLAIGAIRDQTDFEHLLDTDPLDLFLAAPDGSGLRAPAGLEDARQPLFSADGAALYFSRFGIGPNGGIRSLHSSIWAVGVDGSGLRQLTASRGLVFDIPSSASAPRDELAFTRIKCNDNACGSSARALSLTTGAERVIAQRGSDPVHSPDGARIALALYRGRFFQFFLGETSPKSDLYVIDDLRGQRLTRTKNVSESEPSWDPSGQRIAFTREAPSLIYGDDDARSPSRILQINADGSCKTLMFRKAVRRHRNFGKEFAAPAWQPGPGREAGPIAC